MKNKYAFFCIIIVIALIGAQIIVSEKLTNQLLVEQKELEHGMILINEKRLDEAKRIFEKYSKIERYSNSINFAINYAILLDEIGKRELSEHYFKKAYNLNPVLILDERIIEEAIRREWIINEK